jgi:hypothetical protein
MKPATEAPTKTADDSEFKRRWIAFGMGIKGKADGYGIDWRTMSMEAWFKMITDVEKWHHTEEKCAT